MDEYKRRQQGKAPSKGCMHSRKVKCKCGDRQMARIAKTTRHLVGIPSQLSQKCSKRSLAARMANCIGAGCEITHVKGAHSRSRIRAMTQEILKCKHQKKFTVLEDCISSDDEGIAATGRSHEQVESMQDNQVYDMLFDPKPKELNRIEKIIKADMIGMHGPPKKAEVPPPPKPGKVRFY